MVFVSAQTAVTEKSPLPMMCVYTAPAWPFVLPTVFVHHSA